MFEERSAMELVECDDNLAIALALEYVPGVFLELLASGIGLVQLAVHNGVNVSIRRMKGLLAIGAQVVDSEADVTQCFIFVSTVQSMRVISSQIFTYQHVCHCSSTYSERRARDA